MGSALLPRQFQPKSDESGSMARAFHLLADLTDDLSLAHVRKERGKKDLPQKLKGL